MASPKGGRRGNRRASGDHRPSGDFSAAVSSPVSSPTAARKTVAERPAAHHVADVASPVRNGGRPPAPWEPGSPRLTSYREQLRATGQQALQDSWTQAGGSGPPSPVRRFRAPPPSPAGTPSHAGSYNQSNSHPPQLPIQPRQLGVEEMNGLGSLPMPFGDASPMMAFAMPQVIDNEQLAEILRAAAAEACYED